MKKDYWKQKILNLSKIFLTILLIMPLLFCIGLYVQKYNNTIKNIFVQCELNHPDYIRVYYDNGAGFSDLQSRYYFFSYTGKTVITERHVKKSKSVRIELHSKSKQDNLEYRMKIYYKGRQCNPHFLEHATFYNAKATFLEDNTIVLKYEPQEEHSNFKNIVFDYTIDSSSMSNYILTKKISWYQYNYIIANYKKYFLLLGICFFLCLLCFSPIQKILYIKIIYLLKNTQLSNKNSKLLAIYLIFIFISHIFIQNITLSISHFTFIHKLVIFSILIIATPFILNYLSKIYLTNSKINSKVLNRIIKILFYIIPFSIFFIYYIAYYPGGFSPDSIKQYNQAMTNQYQDWHPVLQTLFSFKLPLVVTGYWVGSIVLFQIIVFSIILGYLFNTIYHYTNVKVATIILFLIMCNPLTQSIAMYPWKDVVFAMGTILLMIYSLHIYMTKGQWLEISLHMLLFIMICAVTTVCRHNAILFTFPLLLAIAFQTSLKRNFILVVSVIVIVFIIKVPIYSLMDVEQPGSRKVEILGLPMSIICATVTYDPYHLDSEVLEFAYKVAPKEVWKQRGRYGNYNSVKWDTKTDNTIIEEYGVFRVLKLMIKCLKSEPKICLKNLFVLTEGVYSIIDQYPIGLGIAISKNETGIYTTDNMVSEKIRYELEKYRYSIYRFVPLLLQYGLLHLLIIISILSKNSLIKLNDWKRIFFTFPFFVYNYGTSLLLTSNGDACRFFFYTIFITPIFLILFYCKRDI